MKKIYYKNITPTVAKNRIAKLIEHRDKAWKKYRTMENCFGSAKEDSLVDTYLTEACAIDKALQAMGIETVKCLAD